MKAAKIVDNKVVFVETGDKASLVGKRHPDYLAEFIDIPDHVYEHWYLVNGQWVTEDQIPPTEQEYTEGVQAHIDATAASKGYLDGYAVISYKDSTVPSWANEAATFLAWRDAVWVSAYTTQQQVLAGAIPQPTVQELINSLPVIEW